MEELGRTILLGDGGEAPNGGTTLEERFGVRYG
jgi:hypothetical protein